MTDLRSQDDVKVASHVRNPSKCASCAKIYHSSFLCFAYILQRRLELVAHPPARSREIVWSTIYWGSSRWA